MADLAHAFAVYSYNGNIHSRESSFYLAGFLVRLTCGAKFVGRAVQMNAMNHVQAESVALPGDAVDERLYEYSAYSRGHLTGLTPRVLNAPSRECLSRCHDRKRSYQAMALRRQT